MSLSDRIIAWLKKQVKDAGAKGCVIGLSGGVDSSVAAVLCKRAFPQKTLGIFMPCHSLPQDLEHAKELAEKFSIETKLVDLTSVFSAFFKLLEGKAYEKGQRSLAIANLKPRLRMTTLYYFANILNYLVVGTGNKSELKMGYFTKYGDGGVDLLPLGGLLKFQVRQLAAELKIPSAIIDKAPSAGLWEGQTDEQEMGITYAELDAAIQLIEKKASVNVKPNVLKKVKSRMAAASHKLQLPEIF